MVHLLLLEALWPSKPAHGGSLLGKMSQKYLCGSVPSTVSGEEVIKINYLILQLMPERSLHFPLFMFLTGGFVGVCLHLTESEKKDEGKEKN